MFAVHKFFVLMLSFYWVKSQELSRVPDCNLPAERGTCDDRGFTIKWYYDRYAKRCRQFYYGGCGGNNNRFESHEDCRRVCLADTSQNDAISRCMQQHDAGTCGGDYERWHFDATSKQCVCGWWSGCGGNSNRFYSYNHCMSICGFLVSPSDNFVNLKAAVLCDANSRQIHLNKRRTAKNPTRNHRLFRTQIEIIEHRKPAIVKRIENDERNMRRNENRMEPRMKINQTSHDRRFSLNKLTHVNNNSRMSNEAHKANGRSEVQFSQHSGYPYRNEMRITEGNSASRQGERNLEMKGINDSRRSNREERPAGGGRAKQRERYRVEERSRQKIPSPHMSSTIAGAHHRTLANHTDGHNYNVHQNRDMMNRRAEEMERYKTALRKIFKDIEEREEIERRNSIKRLSKTQSGNSSSLRSTPQTNRSDFRSKIEIVRARMKQAKRVRFEKLKKLEIERLKRLRIEQERLASRNSSHAIKSTLATHISMQYGETEKISNTHDPAYGMRLDTTSMPPVLSTQYMLPTPPTSPSQYMQSTPSAIPMQYTKFAQSTPFPRRSYHIQTTVPSLDSHFTQPVTMRSHQSADSRLMTPKPSNLFTTSEITERKTDSATPASFMQTSTLSTRLVIPQSNVVTTSHISSTLSSVTTTVAPTFVTPVVYPHIQAVKSADVIAEEKLTADIQEISAAEKNFKQTSGKQIVNVGDFSDLISEDIDEQLHNAFEEVYAQIDQTDKSDSPTDESSTSLQSEQTHGQDIELNAITTRDPEVLSSPSATLQEIIYNQKPENDESRSTRIPTTIFEESPITESPPTPIYSLSVPTDIQQFSQISGKDDKLGEANRTEDVHSTNKFEYDGADSEEVFFWRPISRARSSEKESNIALAEVEEADGEVEEVTDGFEIKIHEI